MLLLYRIFLNRSSFEFGIMKVYLIGRKTMVAYKTKEQVHNRALKAIGKSMSELMANMPEKKSGKKSQVGDAWESWFGVDKNSIAGADLYEAGVELKATPFKVLKNGKQSAKERLVLNIINYIEEYDKVFETSSFWIKNQFMELGFYQPDKELPWTDWQIVKAVLFRFPEKDLLIIKQDWELIHNYIKCGQAHELSEGLTMYLGACTKGANKNSLRNQHPSLNAPKAMQRAYSLKSSYMTYILREFVFGNQLDENIRLEPFENDHYEHIEYYQPKSSIISDISVLKNTRLEDYIVQQLEQYKNKSVDELAEIFEIQKNEEGNYPKSINAILINRMLGLYKDIEKTEEFLKANITVKTIRVMKNNTIKESMSFPTFKFKELVQESWEESTLRDTLDSTKFFFVLFQENADGIYYFKGAKFWSMPISDLEGIVKFAWKDTVNTLKVGVQLSFYNGRVTNNFISKSDKRIIHVRPHAAKSSYVANNSNSDQLPVPAQWINKPEMFSDDYMTKQSFWFNNDYVLEQISDLLE